MGTGAPVGERGVYALVVKVGETIELTLRGRKVALKPGIYVYIGSARGPGGVPARVRRHAKREKKVRWHIDLVTTAPSSRVVGAVYASAESPECVLTPALEELGLSHPVRGFGSSDCKGGCASHFFLCNENNAGRCLEIVKQAFRAAGFEEAVVVHFE